MTSSVSRSTILAVLISVVLTFTVTRLYYSGLMTSERMKIIVQKAEVIQIEDEKPKPKVDPLKRSPSILQPGRVNVCDYVTYPMKEGIECVAHRQAEPSTKICVMVNDKDFISAALRRGEGWETGITNTFKRILKSDPSLQVLDIGCNLGVYALIGASLGRKVVAVEPLDENLLYLTKSIRVNKYESLVTIVINAVSDEYYDVEFWRPYGNAGGSLARKVGQDRPDPKLYSGPYSPVSTIQMDNLLEVITFDKAVMKIDIEGYEPFAMRGASRLFDQIDIAYIFMEWSDKGNNPLAKKMVNFLSMRGYKVFNVNDLQPLNVDDTKNWPFDILWKRG